MLKLEGIYNDKGTRAAPKNRAQRAGDAARSELMMPLGLALFFAALFVAIVVIVYRNGGAIDRPGRIIYALTTPIIFVVLMLYGIALSAKLFSKAFGEAAGGSAEMGFLVATPLPLAVVWLWYRFWRHVAPDPCVGQARSLENSRWSWPSWIRRFFK
jgi:hypothetical protein